MDDNRTNRTKQGFGKRENEFDLDRTLFALGVLLVEFYKLWPKYFNFDSYILVQNDSKKKFIVSYRLYIIFSVNVFCK